MANLTGQALGRDSFWGIFEECGLSSLASDIGVLQPESKVWSSVQNVPQQSQPLISLSTKRSRENTDTASSSEFQNRPLSSLPSSTSIPTGVELTDVFRSQSLLMDQSFKRRRLEENSPFLPIPSAFPPSSNDTSTTSIQYSHFLSSGTSHTSVSSTTTTTTTDQPMSTSKSEYSSTTLEPHSPCIPPLESSHSTSMSTQTQHYQQQPSQQIPPPPQQSQQSQQPPQQTPQQSFAQQRSFSYPTGFRGVFPSSFITSALKTERGFDKGTNPALGGKPDESGEYSSKASGGAFGSVLGGIDHDDEGSAGSGGSAKENVIPKTKKTGLKKTTKTRKTKVQKGLRHFSLKVCEKVEQQKVTTYNKVADELVKELKSPVLQDSDAQKGYDEKNIRRRVYDALNVLMAMGIISKEKKCITWIGLPDGVTKDVTALTKEKAARIERIKQKRTQLSELLIQQVCFKNLITRNASFASPFLRTPRLKLPFVVIGTPRETVIQCEMTEDRREMLFTFSGPFSIEEDKDVMKAMGLSRIAPWDLPRLIPREVCQFYPPDSVIVPPNTTFPS